MALMICLSVNVFRCVCATFYVYDETPGFKPKQKWFNNSNTDLLKG